MNDWILNAIINHVNDKLCCVSSKNMSGIVAHNLSGLLWSPLEVPDETDGDATEVQLPRSATEKPGEKKKDTTN
jgi:hypothetical protein